MRLDKYLADMGIGTRKELKKEIRSGSVSVDGQIVKDPGFSVSPASSVAYMGTAVKYEELVYYMLNKPAGIISASTDGREPTVVDLIDEQTRRDLFPAGRLDRDTEGLLLITNDGALAHRLLSPKYHVDKTYYVRVSGTITDADIEAFRSGLDLADGLKCLPADLRILSVRAADFVPASEAGPVPAPETAPVPEPETAPAPASQPDFISEAEVTIREGKFHQIKRMFSDRGKEVLYLKRLSMGSLTLDPKLAPGEYRRLTQAEQDSLKAI